MDKDVSMLVASISRLSAFAVSELINGDTRALKRSAEIIRAVAVELGEALKESAKVSA